MKQRNIFLLPTLSGEVWNLVLFLILSILSLTRLNAQESAIKEISLQEVSTGEEVQFSQYESAPAVVVIFFCNSCPYSTFYVDRIKELTSNYPGIQFLLINSNSSAFVPSETEANMAKFKSDEGITIPYLADKEQIAKRAFDAKKCPEVFIIIPRDQWKVAYRGAIDDNPQVASDVKEEYLKNALDQVLEGSSIATGYQRPIGCVIK